MRRPEQALQIAVAGFMDRISGLIWFHVPNGGGRSRAEGGILKAMGVKRGVPDIVIILPSGKAAFIELKAGKGTLTTEQKAFRDSLGEDAHWAEAKSLEEVSGLLVKWLEPFGFRVPRLMGGAQ